MYRMAIIGVGMISTKAMIPGIRQAKTAELTALGTSSREKAQALSAKHGVDRCYSSYQQLLEDPGIDGVYIGLPNHLHKEWTLKALAHGKHVLCDKPLGMDLAEAREMEAAARAAGRVLMEGFMYRFHPQHALVKELIRKGAIGRVFLFEAHFHYFMEDPDNIRLKRETGGGGLYDVGCYGINSARYILGAEPRSVSGNWRLGAETGVDEFCHFTLRFDGGPVATVTCGTHLPREQRYTVYGDAGDHQGAPGLRAGNSKAGPGDGYRPGWQEPAASGPGRQPVRRRGRRLRRRLRRRNGRQDRDGCRRTWP